MILHAPGWDDYFIILTMLSTAMGSIVLCILTDLGLGRSLYTMTLPEKEEFMRVLYIGNATYPVSATLIKLALLLQYLRVFGTGTRTRVFCKCMIAISAAWGATFMVLRWVPCSPVYAYWDFSSENVRCWGFGSRDPLQFMRVFMAQAVSTSVLDFIIFTIPIQLCFKPETQRKTRFCLLGLFILGFLSISCAILRMVFVIQNFTADTFRFDPSWYDATTDGLASLEVHLAAVCAALPVFWPVLTTRWDRIFVTTEVTVTREFGRFHPKTNTETELHSTSSRQNLTLDQFHQSQGLQGWEPYVGDGTTSLGENETVIEGPAVGKRYLAPIMLGRESREPVSHKSGECSPRLTPIGGTSSVDVIAEQYRVVLESRPTSVYSEEFQTALALKASDTHPVEPVTLRRETRSNSFKPVSFALEAEPESSSVPLSRQMSAEDNVSLKICLDLLTRELSSAIAGRPCHSSMGISALQIWAMIEVCENLRDQMAELRFGQRGVVFSCGFGMGLRREVQHAHVTTWKFTAYILTKPEKG
ncbi:hypothetical protein VTI74DRAFT_4319 [Chaetomium olivicolor]